MPPCRPKQKLAEIHRSASDVASNEVRVHAFKLRGRENAPCQNKFTEPRSEALDLCF